MSAIGEIEKTLLALPVEQRVALAESLLDSLPTSGRDWTEEEELIEAKQRESEIQSGQTRPLSEAELWNRVESNRKR